jgi:hypothetical protein
VTLQAKRQVNRAVDLFAYPLVDEKEIIRQSKRSKLPYEKVERLEETSKRKAIMNQNARIKKFLDFKVGDVVKVTDCSEDARSKKIHVVRGLIIHITPWKFLSVQGKNDKRKVITTVDFNGYVTKKFEVEIIKGFEALNGEANMEPVNYQSTKKKEDENSVDIP